MKHRPHPLRRAILGLVGALLVGGALVTACAPGLVPSLVLGLDGTAFLVLRGGDTQIVVDLTRLGGASDPVALSVTGLPANVTGTFSPPTLAGAATESILTINAAAAAAETSATLTVTGTAGTLSDSVDATLNVEGAHVQGYVQDALGQGIVGAVVTIQGVSVVTGANGYFAITNVSLPYTANVSSLAGDGGLHVVDGLTSLNPVLRPTFATLVPSSPSHGTTVSGSLAGGALAPGEVVVACLEGIADAVYGCDTLAAGDTAYSIGADWFAGGTASVQLHALHYEVDAGGLPTGYLGYETFPLDLADGVATMADLSFDAVASDTLTATTSLPPATVDSAAVVFVRFGPNLVVPVAEIDPVGASFDAQVPVLPAVTYDVLVFAGHTLAGDVYTWKRDVGLDAGPFIITVPAQLVAPADGTPGVDFTTSFSTTAVGGALTYVWFPDGAPGVLYARTTMDTSVTIPDHALGGFAYPAGAAYMWTVIGHGDASVDEAAAGGYADLYTLLLTVNGAGGPGFGGDGTVSLLGVDRAMTFAP